MGGQDIYKRTGRICAWTTKGKTAQKQPKMCHCIAMYLDEHSTKEVSVARVFNIKCKPAVSQKGNRTANSWEKRIFDTNLCNIWIDTADMLPFEEELREDQFA